MLRPTRAFGRVTPMKIVICAAAIVDDLDDIIDRLDKLCEDG